MGSGVDVAAELPAESMGIGGEGFSFGENCCAQTVLRRRLRKECELGN